MHDATEEMYDGAENICIKQNQTIANLEQQLAYLDKHCYFCHIDLYRCS